MVSLSSQYTIATVKNMHMLALIFRLHGLTHNNKHTFLELCMQVEIFLGLSRPRGVLQGFKIYTKFDLG